MNQSGVLILHPAKFEARYMASLLRMSAKYVQNVLYVDFGLGLQLPNSTTSIQPDNFPSTSEMYGILEKIYTTRTRETAAMDIRVLLDNSQETGEQKRVLSSTLDVALLHNSFQSVPGIVEAVHKRYSFRTFGQNTLKFLDASEVLESQDESDGNGESMKLYETCAVGGTFDRMHNGHRLLLSTCCLLSKSNIVVGLSADPLLVNKTLAELIEPFHIRAKKVEEYIDDVKPGLIKDLLPLYDPAGPTKTDPSIECLVVSSETLNGGNAVNNMRKDAGLPAMEIFSIDLVGHEESFDCPSSGNDNKMSSTLGRQQDLGKLLKPVVRRPNSETSNVYVIGLTGGIASGKSAIAKRLEKLGAEIIDADILGHLVYEPGTECYKEIVETFGKETLNPNNTINRKQLGSIVFNDKQKLKLLNSIVWPKIMSEIQRKITEAEKMDGKRICVIDAALLIEAGWYKMVDEIWVTIVPPSEAIERLKHRNGLNKQEAEKRLCSQITNKERVTEANVVLSTLWEPEVTQKQVEKAWENLVRRIKEC